MVLEMIIRIKFLKLLLHMFVLLLVCLRYPTLGLTSRVGEDGNTNIKCIEREREGLLKFKQGLIDEYGHLSSWGSEEEKKDCCSWRGVHCSNLTGHVIMLDLDIFKYYTYKPPLRGKISPSLLELQHLNYLDLSYNDFEGSVIPEFIGFLSSLQYLKLSWANFSGPIPCQLGNLTNLHFLDLSENYGSNVKNLEWLSDLSLLKHLDLSYVDLSEVINWVEAIITKLPLLTELTLSSCKLSDVIPSSISLINYTKSPVALDLSGNSFESSSLYRWLFNFSSSLIEIDLSYCKLQGMIPDAFGNMITLENLGLIGNQLEGGVPKTFGNSSGLRSLRLSYNSLNVPFSKILQNLSGHTENSLQLLRLSHNQLTGSFPDITLFSSLRELDLSYNNLNGSFSKSYATPPSLEILDLSWNRIGRSLPDLSFSLSSSLKTLNLNDNQLEGVISEAHFTNLSSLKFLDLSRNSLVLNFSSDWLPPFQLDTIRLCHCKLGPHFPKWLRTQNNFSEIDFSDTEITDTIPNWFWNQSSWLSFVNLSHNQIYGMLPDLSSKSNRFFIDLRCNKFKGPIPLLPPNITLLNLSKNMFSGSISFLCNTTVFLFLDLSDNLLSGELPDCWMHMEYLLVLKLANNNISGKIPNSMGYLDIIETLQFRNNSFTGELPSSLKNCTRLIFIDLAENRFSGTIPEWIGSLSRLKFLTIQSNQFSGTIPLSMCHLESIQILDLSLNNISGTLPKCLNNFTAMAQKNSSTSTIQNSASLVGAEDLSENTGFLVWKGRDAVYKNTLGLVIGIDISSNKLTGKIPEEIADLVGLLYLNLSGNDLTGGIPRKIGQLTSLDFLDLSNNQLCGEIPTSLSQISRLSVLDLSNNKLSGRIPLGTQLQSFNASTYMGNPGLCGAPLETCPAEKTAQGQDPPNDQDKLITQGFYISMGLGFIVGFWGVCCTLLLNSSWRYAFVKWLEKIVDWFFVMFAVYTTRLKRKLQLYSLKLGAAIPRFCST